MRLQILSILLGLILYSCASKTHVKGQDAGEKDNYLILEKYVNDSLLHASRERSDYGKPQKQIKTKKGALKLARQVLIEKHGKEDPVKDREFVVSEINEFWIVKGLLPKRGPETSGSQLVAIIDSKSGVVLQTFYWK